MCTRSLILLIFVMSATYGTTTGAQKTNKSCRGHQHHSSSHIDDPHSRVFSPNATASSFSSRIYAKWSAWSRCIDCVQRRIKVCISPKCEDSRIYEEKPCGKKRCKRKFRLKQKELHVVQLDGDSSQLTRQAPSKIWSKWSSWSPCSDMCRTQRIRICRKPGRCRKKQQEQMAYCYHDNSPCESYVLNLLDTQKYPHENTRYNYNYNNYDNYNENTTPRRVLSKRRKRRKCGVPFRKTKMLKIIGGIETGRGKWPWHVALLNKFMEVFCGGTLIGSRWVLTASHCIRPYLRARLNEYDLYATDGRELELTIHKMFQHPKFNHKTVDNDIALLQLPRVVTGIPLACLPNKRPMPLQVCSVMGWGKIRTEDTYGTNRLHEAQLPIVDAETCRRSYRHFLITSNMLCAGWPSGKSDTCAGDSGGGLMCPFKAKSSARISYAIQGITSFGDGCGLKNKYGIYTTVFNYLEWIHYVMDHYS